MLKTLIALSLCASAAAAQSEVSAAPARVDRPWQVRLGVLAGASMQKTDPELGLAVDAIRFSDRLRLVADLTFAGRSNEVTLVPMVGVRFLPPLPNPRLEVWVHALAGLALTFMRGATAAALPFRIGAGITYALKDSLAVGGSLSADVGPLIAPFWWTYAALHVTAVLAWSFT